MLGCDDIIRLSDTYSIEYSMTFTCYMILHIYVHLQLLLPQVTSMLKYHCSQLHSDMKSADHITISRERVLVSYQVNQV